MRPCHVVTVTDDGAPCAPLGPCASTGDLLAWAFGRDRTKESPPTREGFVLVGVTSEGFARGETPTFHLVCRRVGVA